MTKIEWTDESWNPVVGCSKVSAGCKNCYAERMAARLWRMGRGDYGSVLSIEDYKWNGKICLRYSFLDKPLHWKKPRMIFVCSMGDLFHPAVPFSYIDKVVDVAEKCPQHTLQFLTKRASIMYDYSKYRDFKWPENIIGMVTAENQERADWCIPYLLQCGFKTTGVSFEPLLGGIDSRAIQCSIGGLLCKKTTCIGCDSAYKDNYIGIDWAIIGCESGPKRRPCKIEWVRDLVRQCQAVGVRVFVKQLNINGKVEKDINKFPEEFPREFPNGG